MVVVVIMVVVVGGGGELPGKLASRPPRQFVSDLYIRFSQRDVPAAGLKVAP